MTGALVIAVCVAILIGLLMIDARHAGTRAPRRPMAAPSRIPTIPAATSGAVLVAASAISCRVTIPQTITPAIRAGKATAAVGEMARAAAVPIEILARLEAAL